MLNWFSSLIYKNFFLYRIWMNLSWLLFLTNFIKNKICKPNGISVCVRINQDIYVENLIKQIDLIYDFVDEIIIHYNSLKKPNILKSNAQSRSKIILKEYGSVLDFVQYTNDFLDEYKFRWLMMFDSDILIDEASFKKMLLKIKKSKPNKIHFYSGINVFNKDDNNIGYINLNKKNVGYLKPFAGIGDFFAFCPEFSKCKKLMKYKSDFENISGKKYLHEVYKNSFDYITPINKYKKKYWGIMFLHLSFLNLSNKFNEKIDDYFSLSEIKHNLKSIKQLTQNFWIYFFMKKIITKSNQEIIEKILAKKEVVYKKR